MIHFNFTWILFLRMKKTLKCKRSNYCTMKTIKTYVEDHPMRGFSHLSRVSNSNFHLLWPNVPDCIAFFAGRNILALRDFKCSSGTPVKKEMSVYKKVVNFSLSFLQTVTTTKKMNKCTCTIPNCSENFDWTRLPHKEGDCSTEFISSFVRSL